MVKPRVIALLPRPIREVESTLVRLWRAEWFHLCLCLAANEAERDSFREFSSRNSVDILTLFDSKPWSPQQVAAAIAVDVECHASTSVAILIFEGPGCLGFEEGHGGARNEKLAEELSKLICDVQVLEYASSWEHSPPRIR